MHPQNIVASIFLEMNEFMEMVQLKQYDQKF